MRDTLGKVMFELYLNSFISDVHRTSRGVIPALKGEGEAKVLGSIQLAMGSRWYSREFYRSSQSCSGF